MLVNLTHHVFSPLSEQPNVVGGKHTIMLTGFIYIFLLQISNHPLYYSVENLMSYFIEQLETIKRKLVSLTTKSNAYKLYFPSYYSEWHVHAPV